MRTMISITPELRFDTDKAGPQWYYRSNDSGDIITAVLETEGAVNWEVRLDRTQRQMTCTLYDETSEQIFYQHDFRLKPGTLVLVDNEGVPNHAKAKAVYRTPQLQNFLNKYGLTAMAYHYPNRKSIIKGRTKEILSIVADGNVCIQQEDGKPHDFVVTNSRWTLTEFRIRDEPEKAPLKVLATVCHWKLEDLEASLQAHGVMPVKQTDD